jgi:hypothetical protein
MGSAAAKSAFVYGCFWLGDDRADAHARIERGVRILEHRLDGAAVVAIPLGVQVRDVRALENRASILTRPNNGKT